MSSKSDRIPDLYLYLTQAEWCDAWINGGKVPINPASTYRSDHDAGTSTTDEVRHVDPGVFPDWATGPDGVIRVSDPNINFTVTGGGTILHGDGPRFDIVGNYRQWQDDAHILSLSFVASREVMDKLGKAACVRIRDVSRLKAALDRQMGVASRLGPVTYTETQCRDHFTKGPATAWQSEFRFVWHSGHSNEMEVVLPPGIAERVGL